MYLFYNVYISTPAIKIYVHFCIYYSSHDARVYDRSDLKQQISDTPQVFFPNSKFHIIGDSAFPLSPYLMASYKRTLANNRRKIRYNGRFNRLRSIVENAFSELKNTWRRLFYVKAKLRKASKIIASCFALHNFLIMNDERHVRYQYRGPRNQQQRLNEYAEDYFDHLSGREKREELLELM